MATKLGSIKLNSRMRSTGKLEAGSFEFEAVGFGQWNITDSATGEVSKVDYLSLKTSAGMRGLSLGSVYYTTLAKENNAPIGELLLDRPFSPNAGLKGVLVVTKVPSTDANGKPYIATQYGMENVALSELV